MCFAVCNFCWFHRTTKVNLAMEARLTDHGLINRKRSIPVEATVPGQETILYVPNTALL